MDRMAGEAFTPPAQVVQSMGGRRITRHRAGFETACEAEDQTVNDGAKAFHSGRGLGLRGLQRWVQIRAQFLARHPCRALYIENPLCRHTLPLGNRLPGDPNTLRQSLRGTKGGNSFVQCVVHTANKARLYFFIKHYFNDC